MDRGHQVRANAGPCEEKMRTIWLGLAVFSFILAVDVFLPLSTVGFELARLIHIVIPMEGKVGDLLRTMVVPSILIFYSMMTVFLVSSGNKIPFKIPNAYKEFLNSTFIFVCLYLSYTVEDPFSLGFWYCICFNIIPLANLFALIENSGFSDCFLVLLIEISLYHTKNGGGWIPVWVVLVLTFAFQSVKAWDQSIKRTIRREHARAEQDLLQ